MAQAQRDENHVTVGLANNQSDVTEPLLVDPVTGALLIDVALVSSTVPVDPGDEAPRDPNHVTTGLAVEDDATAATAPLLIDNRNDRLWVDIA